MTNNKLIETHAVLIATIATPSMLGLILALTAMVSQ